MSAKSLDDKIKIISTIAAPVIEAMGLEFWGVEVIESGRSLVRVYVDAPAADTENAATDANSVASESPLDFYDQPRSGVDVEACAEISRHMALALEVEDVFPSAYVLEVSSPGFSRPFFRLEQMPPYIGLLVEIVLKESIDDSGRKKFQGILTEVSVDSLTIDLAEKGKEPNPASLPWRAVYKARRLHIFEEKVKPGKKPASKQ